MFFYGIYLFNNIYLPVNRSFIDIKRGRGASENDRDIFNLGSFDSKIDSVKPETCFISVIIFLRSLHNNKPIPKDR